MGDKNWFPQPENRTSNIRIFGIGLGKTGTSSLNRAMQVLGCQSIHGPKLDRIVEYNFCNDINITFRYKFLDHCFPGSKFILTVRDMKSWLKSNERWLKIKTKGGLVNPEIDIELSRAEPRFFCYGCTIFNKNKYIDAYEKHYKEVNEHFKNRKQDLLIFDVREGWEKLCKFLNKPIPTTMPFPHVSPMRKPWKENCQCDYCVFVRKMLNEREKNERV
jgi:hypothetical protein